MTIYLTYVIKKHIYSLWKDQLNKLGAPLHQQYCELKYITLAYFTEYIAARLVTVQILHFTGDKVKTPAVKMFVSPIRCISLYDCIDNKNFGDEFSKTGGFH